MSQRVSYDQVKNLNAANQGLLSVLDYRLASAANSYKGAQAAVNVATTESEKEILLRWQNLIFDQSIFVKNLTDSLREKQSGLQVEFGVLEASIIANCGGLDISLPSFSGDWLSL